MGEEKKTINVGMVGYKMMGRAHSHAYRDVPFYFDSPVTPRLDTIVGRDSSRVGPAAEKMGWARHATDWCSLIDRRDIDLVDIVTPNDTHSEIAIAAAEAGKHVLCEKPLALSVEEAVRMRDAVKKNNVTHMLCHNYRFAPAVQFAKQLIDSGKLGRIYHIRATFLQDWLMDPNYPLTWRMQKNISGSGTLGDLGAHIIDLARFLVGEFDEVAGMMKTFVKERPLGDTVHNLQTEIREGEWGEVTVDDASAFLATFQNGAMGTFEASRFSRGNRAGNRFEINGEKGSIRWDMENMNNLEVYFEEDEAGLQGFKTINCTEAEHPFAGNYWPAAHILGYEHTFVNLIASLMDNIGNQTSVAPNFEDGVMNQAILEAVERSVHKRGWTAVSEIYKPDSVKIN